MFMAEASSSDCLQHHNTNGPLYIYLTTTQHSIPDLRGMVIQEEMKTLALPTMSRHQCLRQIWRSLSSGSLNMDREMVGILGITIDSSYGEHHTTNPSSISQKKTPTIIHSCISKALPLLHASTSPYSYPPTKE